MENYNAGSFRMIMVTGFALFLRAAGETYTRSTGSPMEIVPGITLDPIPGTRKFGFQAEAVF